MNREQWLRTSLRKQFEFIGWGGREYVWLPKSTEFALIFGLIQTRKPHTYHTSPSLGGEEVNEDFWQGAYLFLDPSHHEDGQKLAIENDVVGAPNSLAKALFGHINALEIAPYVIKPSLMFDKNDFWSFSEESGDRLKYVRFSFVVPNMWDPQSDLERDLRDTGKDTDSDEVEVAFKGSRGVKTRNQRIEKAVDYVSRGAGQIRAKNMENESFSSKARATKTSVPREELEVSDLDSVARVARTVLGRG